MEPIGLSSPPARPREQLTATECLRLLSSVAIGRIV
jgi:hypothetical protein